jgi:hypothetical protein
MNLMRASLGVHCDFCHVVTKENGWQWEKDEKKTKLRAREMIGMVIEINKANFKGEPVVSCFTCHQGQIKPQGLPGLPQDPPTLFFALPKPEPLPAWKQIKKAYIDFLGGTEVAEKASNITYRKGVRESYDGTYIFTEWYHQGPDKWLMKSKSVDEAVTRGYNGKIAWIQVDPEKPREMKAAEKERFFELIRDFQMIPARLNDADLQVTGRSKIGDQDAYVVETSLHDSSKEQYFFDVKTGQLLKCLILKKSKVGMIPEQILYGSYHEIEKMKFPFLMSPAYVDPWIGTPVRFTEMKWDPVDATVFDMPTSQ